MKLLYRMDNNINSWRQKAESVMDKLILEYPKGFVSDDWHYECIAAGIPKIAASRLASPIIKRAAKLKRIVKTGQCRLSTRNSSVLAEWIRTDAKRVS